MALIVDFCLYAFEGEKATISYTILTDSRKLLLIPLLFGILTGHFFWSQCWIKYYGNNGKKGGGEKGKAEGFFK